MKVIYDGNPFSKEKGCMKRDEAIAYAKASSKVFKYRCGFGWKGAEYRITRKDSAIEYFSNRSDSGMYEDDDFIYIQTWTDIDYD